MEATLNSPFGRTILGTTAISVGSTSDNQLVLNDASVGSRHAEIRPEGQGYSIVDLGNASGTFVNGERVYPNVPQMLQNGDTIRVGDTTLTYEVSSGSSVAPTVYAGSGQLSDAGYSPTVLAPGADYVPDYAALSGQTSNPYGSTTLASSGQTGDPYGTGATTLASSAAAPPPPAPAISNPYAVSDPYGAGTGGKKKRRLPIILGAIGGVLVVVIVLFVVLASRGPSTTPTQTFNAFCSALKAHNGQSAYGMYSSGAQQQISENDIQQLSNLVTDCVASNVDDSAGTGTLTYSLQNYGKISFNDTLTAENGAWKIAVQKPISTPNRTLFDYCVALIKGDYQTAYNQFSSKYQSNQTEAQYAGSFNEKPSNCTLSNVDDSAGKGVVTMTFSAGSTNYNETLTNEGGTWKIDSEAQQSTPTLTLTNYCNALLQQDYQTAYSYLSSGVQSQESQSQYAGNFNGVKVTGCTPSNVDDNAGTGTISYTLDNGKTYTAAYTLVQESGTWKINSEKLQ
jgi:hypothetical protein